MRDKYSELLNNPPVLEFKSEAKEVIFNLISVMCDNKYTWKLKKNPEGEFKLYTNGYSFSNFQTSCDREEIEWAADEYRWSEVTRLINSGTSKVESVRSR